MFPLRSVDPLLVDRLSWIVSCQVCIEASEIQKFLEFSGIHEQFSGSE